MHGRAEVEACVQHILDGFEEIERLSDSVPRHPKGRRSRTGLVCSPEHQGWPSLNRVEDCITEWSHDLLRARGYRAFCRSDRRYPSGRIPDIVVEFDHFQFWIEAKPIWGDWISDGSSGDRVRNSQSGPRNIGQLAADARKLERERAVAGDWWGLLGIVFDWDEGLVPRLIGDIGPAWRHHGRRVPDLCCEPGELFGCTPVMFWRPAVQERARSRADQAVTRRLSR